MKRILDMTIIFLILFSTCKLETTAAEPWFQAIQEQKLFRFDLPTIDLLLKDFLFVLDTHPDLKNKPHKFFVTNDSRLNLDGFKRINSIDDIESSLISESVFTVFFHTDDDYLYTLKKIINAKGKFLSLHYVGKTRYIWVDKNAMLAFDKTLSFGNRTSHHDANFSLGIHETICLCLDATKNLPGDYVEIGVYKGGSALTALHYMGFAEIKRKSYFLDTYDGMTYEEAHGSADILWDNTHTLWGVEQTMAYITDLFKTTNQHFEVVQSNICSNDLPQEIKQIAVCNVDVDLYEATLAALIKVAPLIVKGGIIICEDPTSTPALGGALLAMEEFLETPNGKKFTKMLNVAQYLLIKLED